MLLNTLVIQTFPSTDSLLFYLVQVAWVSGGKLLQVVALMLHPSRLTVLLPMAEWHTGQGQLPSGQQIGLNPVPEYSIFGFSKGVIGFF